MDAYIRNCNKSFTTPLQYTPWYGNAGNGIIYTSIISKYNNIIVIGVPPGRVLDVFPRIGKT